MNDDEKKYELTYNTEYKNEAFPFLNVTDENKRFCPIFKEIYTDKDFSQLELLYFEINKEEKRINFQIGIVTNSNNEKSTDNVTNVVWQFGLPYSNEHFLVAHGNPGSMGYVVIDMDAALKLDKPLWPNFTWVEINDTTNKTTVKKQHFISRPEYLLDHRVIAEVNDSPRIKDVILNNSCRYVENYNIDANIVELYIERQGSWGKLSIVQKKDNESYTKSYISPNELNLFIKEEKKDTLYQLYATNANDPEPKRCFDYVVKKFKRGNDSLTVRIIFRYNWTPVISDGETFLITDAAYDLTANMQIAAMLSNEETKQDTVNECHYLHNTIDTELQKFSEIAKTLTSTIPDGCITESKLSNDVKKLIGSSNNSSTITNQPDDYFLCSNQDNRLTLADRHSGTNAPQPSFVVVRGSSMPSANLQPNTIYLITSAINLNNSTLTLGQGTCLQFRGGTISNGTILGQGSLIDAPECRIFQENITLVGEFSNQFPIEWWGAMPSAKFDSAAAINAATASGAKNIVAHGENYYVKSTVFIEKEHISLTFDGNLVAQFTYTNEGFGLIDVKQDADKDFVRYTRAALEVKVSNVNVKMRGIISESQTPLKVWEQLGDIYPSAGLRLSRNCHNSNFCIDFINNFRMGILLQPRIDEKNTTAGIQYCKFTFQMLSNIENLVFDLKGDNFGKNLWINENQFFGGRIGDPNNSTWVKYGIIFKGERVGTGENNEQSGGVNGKFNGNHYDPINGNVFHSIGFEGLMYPIHNLWLWTSNRFYDLRMSEDIEGKVFISMAFCEDLLFTFKSNITDYIQLTEVDDETGSVKYIDFFYFDKIQTDNQCKNIVVKERSFTLMYSNTEHKLIPFQNTDIVDFLKANVKPSFSF